MIRQRILTDNGTPANVNIIKKPLGSTQKGASRMKTSALGEIQNTLHSRSTNAPSKGSTPSVKPIKSKNIFIYDDNNLPKTCVKKDNKISSDKIKEDFVEEDLSDFHNHALCEQADDANFNQTLSKYRFTDKEIDNFVKATSGFRFTIPEDIDEGPLEDILIPKENVDKKSSKGIFSDFISFEVPPPSPI